MVPSWTLPKRPDLSLYIGPVKGRPAPFEPVWLYFDAKYRVDSITALFGAADRKGYEEALRRGRALPADLLKIDAYRDAIRRSAGAWVIYPGDDPDENQVYQEILRGLGAFPLRPGKDGGAEGTGSLRRFIDDVLTHVASQVTQLSGVGTGSGRFMSPILYRRCLPRGSWSGRQRIHGSSSGWFVRRPTWSGS